MSRAEDTVYLGIDLGTSGVRVEAYSEDGSQLHLGRSPISSQDTEAWIRALRESMRGTRWKRWAVRAAVDSTSGSFIICGSHGEPLHPPVMYYEKAVRGYQKAARLSSARMLESRGFKLSPTSPLPKILELMEEKPSIFSKARWILPPATWLLYRLRFREGEEWRDLSVDYSNALKFGLDITSPKPRWFEALFEEAGVPLSLLPTVVSPGDPVGPAESRLAESLGLRGAELYHGMTDGNAAALAGGALSEGDMVIYSGSTTVPKYVSPCMKPHPAIYYHRHPLGGYLAGAATSATGGMMTWLAEKVFGVPVNEAFSLMEEAGDPVGIVFFPPGARSPFNDPLLGASLLGLWPLREERRRVIGRIMLASALGITFLEYNYIRLFEQLFGKRVEEVKLTGGGTRSPLWNKLRASIYERRVKVYGDQVAVGTVIPVLIRAGKHRSIREVEERFLKVRETLKPDPSITDKYRSLRDRYMDAWGKLREAYHSLQ